MEQYNGARYNPFPRRVGADSNGYPMDPPVKYNKEKKSRNSQQSVPPYYHGMPQDYYVSRQGEPRVMPQDIMVIPPGGGFNNQWHYPQQYDKVRKNKNKNKNKEKVKNPPGLSSYFGFNQPMNGNHFNLVYDNVQRGDRNQRIYAKRGMEPPSSLPPPSMPPPSMPPPTMPQSSMPPPRPKKGLPRTYFFEEPPGNPTYATTITRSIPEGPEESEEIPGLVLYRGQSNIRDDYPRPSKPDPVPPEVKSTVDPEAVLQDFDAKLAEFDSVASFPTKTAGDQGSTIAEPSGVDQRAMNYNRTRDILGRDLTRIYGPRISKPAYEIPKPPQHVSPQVATTSTPNDTPRDVPPLNLTSVDSVVNQPRPEKAVFTHDQEKSYDFTGEEAAFDEFNTLRVADTEPEMELPPLDDPRHVATAIGGLPAQQETYKKHLESETPVLMSLGLEDSSPDQDKVTEPVSDNVPLKDDYLTAKLVSKIPEPPQPPPRPPKAGANAGDKTSGIQDPPNSETTDGNPDIPKIEAMDAKLVSRIPEISPQKEDKISPSNKSAVENKEETGFQKPKNYDAVYDKVCKDNENCHIVPEEVILYYPGKDNNVLSDSNKMNPNNILQTFVDGGQQFSLGLDKKLPNDIDPKTGKPANWQKLN